MDAPIGWVDWCLLAVLVLSVLIGALRGFVFEVLSLAGWFVAWFAARWGGPELAPHLPIGSAGSMPNAIAGFALAFIAALVVWGLLARLVRGLLHATPLQPFDRLLGALFGLLRGGLALLLLALVVGWTPAAASLAWRTSLGASWLTGALHGMLPLLTPGLAPGRPA